ncbi:hypothetical protein E2320_000567, partial [Naja naja]
MKRRNVTEPSGRGGGSRWAGKGAATRGRQRAKRRAGSGSAPALPSARWEAAALWIGAASLPRIVKNPVSHNPRWQLSDGSTRARGGRLWVSGVAVE